MISVAQLIERIETRQRVLNAATLTTEQLAYQVTGVGALDKAQPQQLSFLADAKYSKTLANSQAGVILLNAKHQSLLPADSIGLLVASPYLAYASCSQLFEAEKVILTAATADPSQTAIVKNASDLLPNEDQDRAPKRVSNIHPQAMIAATARIHPTAIIDAQVEIGEGVEIGPYCIIEAAVVIGAGSRLMSHVHIATGSRLGEQCLLYPHVVIGHLCQLGDHVRVYAHASIGSDGFGYAPSEDPATSGWERIAQLGRVIIGNHVRIGSQSCIDRGAIEDTRIGDYVIVDNLVQIAHNVTIGEGTAIAANTGIAGSVNIGKRCIIAGAVGITGHLDITDDVTLTAMTMVTKSLTESGSYSSGTVAMPSAKWRRAVVKFRQV